MQFEFEFELRKLNDHSNGGILDRVRVYTNLRSGPSFELRNVILRTHGPKYRDSNDHSNCAIQIQFQIAHFAVMCKQLK